MDFFDPILPVYVKVEGAIGFLLLNRAEKKNALSEAMWSAIPQALDVLTRAPEVRVIVFTSSTEGVFAAGADISELQEIAASAERQETNRIAIREAQRALARSEKPVLAQIDGACIGGGCGLALHCDMRFASSRVKMGITPAKLGIVYPLNDTKQLVDLVGPSKAKSMLLTGRILGADEALRIGLVDEVVEGNVLAERVLEFADQIAAVSQFSVRQMKKLVQRVLDGQVDDDADTAAIFKEAQEGVDAAEGIKAFLEKRPPNFSWKGE